jgi:hypothetical protein
METAGDRQAGLGSGLFGIHRLRAVRRQAPMLQQSIAALFSGF